MLEALEQDLLAKRPDWVLVYGDTNSTLAGALAAVKLHIPVAHVEAGLRSYNRRMPEEINRVVADCVSALLFCPTRAAVENLAREGITRGVHRVGDVMYDSVLYHAARAADRSTILSRLGLGAKAFYLATVHRAENTDDPGRLAQVLEALGRLARPVVLPLHPRTRKTLGAGLERLGGRVRAIEPVPYLDMLVLEKSARMILTDSGGVQKEAYWFGVPCVTLRDETEWVELAEAGCNRIVGTSAPAIVAAVEAFESAGAALPQDRPQDLYGDGAAAEKVVRILAQGA
jgi:UDP-GlcNAc3NAcA epimerase